MSTAKIKGSARSSSRTFAGPHLRTSALVLLCPLSLTDLFPPQPDQDSLHSDRSGWEMLRMRGHVFFQGSVGFVSRRESWCPEFSLFPHAAQGQDRGTGRPDTFPSTLARRLVDLLPGQAHLIFRFLNLRKMCVQRMVLVRFALSRMG